MIAMSNIQQIYYMKINKVLEQYTRIFKSFPKRTYIIKNHDYIFLDLKNIIYITNHSAYHCDSLYH